MAVCAAGFVAAAACSTSSTPDTPKGNGAAPATGGSNAGGGGAASTAGSGPIAGGGSASGGAGGGGAGGTGVDVPTVCKAGATPVNGSGLTVSAPDIGAFKYAPPPATNMTKLAYDPVSKLVVILAQDGKMWSMDPAAPLPTTAQTTPVTTTSEYNAGGYTPNEGYDDHRGIVFGADGSLYILAAQGGESSGVNIKKGVPGATADAPRTWSTIVTTSQGFKAGNESAYNHSFSGIVISDDGMSLYFSSGSRTEHGEDQGEREFPITSAIFKVPTAGTTDLKSMDENALKPFLFADGFRNAFDLALNAQGDLIATENGPDMDLPDELNFVEQGKHYGFPWRFSNVDNPVRDAAYNPEGDKRLTTGYGGNKTYKADPGFPPPPAGVTFTDPIINFGPDANRFKKDRDSDAAPAGPEGLPGLTGHRSPLGIAFDRTGALCGEYYKQGFVVSYGAVVADALGDAGGDVLLTTLTKAGGAYTMKAKQIAKGMKAPIDSVLVGNRLFVIGNGESAQIYVLVLPTA